MNDTAALLDALTSYFGRYVVLSPEQRTAIALWVLHAYVVDVFSTTPYLLVTSAEPRSGKTRVLECLAPIVPVPETLTALTEAVLFRVIDSEKPTLLIDETDAIFKDSKFGPSEKQEGLRAILNAGYRKGTRVARCAPGSNEIQRFVVYGPKVLAGIGHLPPTIEDRGLAIRLTRRTPDEQIERFRYETGLEWGVKLKPRLEAWAPYGRIQLQNVRPVLPDELDDRAQDAYEVLIAIADLAGEPWATVGREALVSLRSLDTTVRESMGVRVFRDIATFAERLARMERIATKDLLAWLYEHGDEPYEDWWGESSGKKASRRLALILEEYDVRPSKYWEDGQTVRGYVVSDILAAQGRYLGPNTPDTPEPASIQGSGDSQHARIWMEPGVLEDGANPHGYADPGVSGVLPYGDQPVPGSPEWLGQASMDELRAWAERLDGPEFLDTEPEG